MQILIEYLTNFNSKERFFLVGQLLGNPSFVLTPNFRNELGSKLGLQIPVDAFSAMDYHLDWLYASLVLASEGVLSIPRANDARMIKAQQEDVDWLIAFQDQAIYHLVLIEAKGVTGWTNKQMSSKAARFREMFGESGDNWQNVVPHFVLVSPKVSEKLFMNDWPQWMAPNGQPLCLKLIIPSNLMRVCRCDKDGIEDRDGQFWMMKER